MTAYSSSAQAALQTSYRTSIDGNPQAISLPNSRSKRVKYWRRPDGWITTGPVAGSDPAEYAHYIQGKRYRELPDRFGNEQVGLGRIQTSHPGRTTQWLEPFLEAGGHVYICGEQDASFGTPGEYLMPVEQILALRMHTFDWMKKDRPELADHEDVPCPYGCTMGDGSRRQFTKQEDVEQHINAVHRDAVPSRATGEAIAAAMLELRGQGIATDAATIAAIVQATISAMNAPAPQPERERYPEGEPTEEWHRPQLLAYMKDKEIPFPDGYMKMGTEYLFSYISAFIEHEKELASE